MKNKFLSIILISLFILALTIPIVTANDSAVVTSLFDEEPTTGPLATDVPQDTTLPSVVSDDVVLFTNDITIDYIVDGNLFIWGDNITIDSQIGGSVFIYSKSLTITENANISGSIYSYSDTLVLDGIVSDLYTFTRSTLDINGYVYRDLRANSEIFNFSGIIGRNAYIDSSNIALSTSTESPSFITGDLNYYSDTELILPEEAVEGEIIFSDTSEGILYNQILLSLAGLILCGILVYYISLILAPNFTKSANFFVDKNIIKKLSLGIITTIILTILIVIFSLLLVTIPIAVILLFLLCIGFIIGIPITAIIIANTLVLIAEKNNNSNKYLKLSCIISFLFFVWLISLIPYVGIILITLINLFGFGAIVYNFKNNLKTDSKK